MFTGIVEEVGSIEDISSFTLTILAEKIIMDMKLGDSIAVNGVCLTAKDINKKNFKVDLSSETFRRTSFKKISKNDKVNLERAMRIDARFGGHIVLGHVDGICRIKSIKRDGEFAVYSFKADSQILKYVVEKGSITLDGISLTIAFLRGDEFGIHLIPHTLKETTLLDKKVGDLLNVENDIIGKYVERILNFNKE